MAAGCTSCLLKLVGSQVLSSIRLECSQQIATGHEHLVYVQSIGMMMPVGGMTCVTVVRPRFSTWNRVLVRCVVDSGAIAHSHPPLYHPLSLTEGRLDTWR